MKEEFELQALRCLQADPTLSQRALAKQLGISLGRTNFHLRALMEKGFVKLQSLSRNPGRIRYMLTPHGIEERARLTRGFIKRKEAEYAKLEGQLKELRAEAEIMRNSNGG